MPKPKIYYKIELPSTVVAIVKALCADYNRREQAIKSGNVSGVVLVRFVELNEVIDAAFEEIEGGIRMDMYYDIVKRRGYNNSSLSYYMAKNTYYRRKSKLIYDMAKNFALI